MANDLNLRVLFDMVDRVTRPLRNVLNANTATATSLRETRDQLRNLDRTQRDVGEFRQLRAGAQATGAELAQARARVAAMAQALHANGPPTQAMARDFDAARQAAARLTQQNREQHIQLAQLRTRLSGAGIDTRNLAQHERELRLNIQNTTEAMQRQQRELAELAARQRRLAEARERMNATRETAGKMQGAGVGMMAAGAATGAALTIPVSAYAAAEDSATNLKGALMQAGTVVPPEFEKINALAMKMGDKLPGTTADFQDMMTMLVRQGIPAQNILNGVGEASAYLGVQLKKPPAEAAEFAAKMQDATRTASEDMLGLMDVIQKGFNLGVDDNNMLQGFVKLGPAMDTIKIAGLEGAKALAPLLVMADQAGMAGEAAGNAYRKIFQLGMDSKKVAKANKSLGKNQQLNFTDGKGEFGGMDNMFKQLDKLKDLSTQKRLSVLKEVFGDDAETLGAVSILITKGAQGYAEVQAKMTAQASLQERVNAQLGTLKNLWEAATGTFSNTMVAFGETIAPELKATSEWLGNTAQNVGAWARENPRLAGSLMKAAAALAVILVAGGALLLMVGSVLGPLAMLQFSMTTLGMQGSILARVLGVGAGALRLVSTAVLFLGRALLMNPVGLLITAIGVAALLIYKYWTPITAFFGGIWDQVRAAFSGGIAGIGALIMNWSPYGLFYQAFAAVMGYFGIDLPAKFSTFGANIIAGLVNGITNGLGAVKTAITAAADNTVGWFKEKLGIHSPSRVFGELGGFVSEGAAIGIGDGQGKVTAAAAALAAAAVTSFGAPNLAAAAQLSANAPTAPVPAPPAAAGVPRLATPVALSVSNAAATAPAPLAPKMAAIAQLIASSAAVPPAAADALKMAAAAQLATNSTALAMPASSSQKMTAAGVAVTETAPVAIDTRKTVLAPAGGGQGAGAGGRAGAAGGTNTYTITINPAPGADPAAIARAVAAELDRRERSKQARQGSRLTD
ncbi:MAG: phage tail tape measure protein [Duganella sp.]